MVRDESEIWTTRVKFDSPRLVQLKAKVQNRPNTMHVRKMLVKVAVVYMAWTKLRKYQFCPPHILYMVKSMCSIIA